MLIVSVFSRPQLLACIARMEKEAEQSFQRAKQNQPGGSPWEVLDYGDVVVHVFTPDQREYYDIESFYMQAEEVELPFQQEEGQQAQQAGQWTTRVQ
jgi:ribosome-associated protein